jgi:hypothetical protein
VTSDFHPLRTFDEREKSGRMYRPFVIAVFTLVSCCSSPAKRRQEALMNEIETSIHLPTGARSLASYARYYAYVTPDEIVGEYMLPHLDDPPANSAKISMRTSRPGLFPVRFPLSKERKSVLTNEFG